ncbi:MAG: class IV adenylate cyclase [Bacteroidetes bacterium]|nr:class IV adenylate cyclase [Bacteroidota bacterium]
MPYLNFEFKAKAENILALEKKIQLLGPLFIGEDHQVDTYFNVPAGRLKLREGNIESALIFYERKNIAGAKQSDIILFEHRPDENLKKILVKVNGIKVVVEKFRRIYFIENVKFHFDSVKDLGEFVEVEAIDQDGKIDIEKLKQQCDYYSSFLGISPSDYIAISYSDMLLQDKQSFIIRH